MKLLRSFFACHLFFIVVILSATLSITEGFATQIQNTASRNAVSQLHLASIESSSIMLTLSSPILSSGLSSVSFETPSIASELMEDASHVSDFLSFVDFSEMPLALPTLAIASHIFCMVSDYLPHHNILPLEFAYHSIMLAIASASILKTVKDIVTTRDSSLTMQDRRCFVSLFRPVGGTWVQYKRLHEAGVFEWKELTPESVIASNEIYWLQSGSVNVKSEGRDIQTLSSKSRHLFGNLEAALSYGSSTKESKGSFSRTTIRAGKEGAKVLKIDALKLKEVTERDQSLKVSIRSVLLKGMQENIAALTI